MVAGHLQEKNGYFYIVLSYKDENGKRKTPWFATDLPVKGNKKRAEALLLEKRQSFMIPVVPVVQDDAPEEEMLFTDFLQSWLPVAKSTVKLTTYASYASLIKSSIAPYFQEREITLKGLTASDIQGFYPQQLERVNANTVIHYHAIIHRALKYEGTFTHFATADCAEQLDFYEQHRRFEEALRLIREAGFNPGIVHAANSASIFRYPQVHYDMVRLGICLYGLDYNPAVSGGSVALKPAMSIRAEISAVKEPQVGEGVSYGMNYRVGKPVQIATLPLGYADGVRRELTKKGFKVLWNGRPVSQVGNICMDQMMIEIPLGYSVHGVKGGGAQVGDEVVIIGTQGDYELTADTMADALGTITHEITCLFGLRLPRVYV